MTAWGPILILADRGGLLTSEHNPENSWSIASQIDAIGGTSRCELVSGAHRVSLHGTSAAIGALIDSIALSAAAPAAEVPAFSPVQDQFYVTFARTVSGLFGSSHVSGRIESHADLVHLAAMLGRELGEPVTILAWTPLPKEPTIVLATKLPGAA